jgi:hypothetical protein
VPSSGGPKVYKDLYHHDLECPYCPGCPKCYDSLYDDDHIHSFDDSNPNRGREGEEGGARSPDFVLTPDILMNDEAEGLKSRKKQGVARATVIGAVVVDGIKLHSPIPDVMRFESWYYEGSFKHLLRMAFLTAEEVFQVYVDDDLSPFSLVISGRSGLPLQVWDLHVI